MKIPLKFDAVRIGIGESYIARNTSLRMFVYLLKAVGIDCAVSEEDTVSIDEVSLLHNLHGKCYFRFRENEAGVPVFAGARLVIDPEQYPGLRAAAGPKRMSLLKDFIAVSLSDKLRAMADQKDGANGFQGIDETTYESRFVRVHYELDHYHAVITVSYKEREAAKEEPPLWPDAAVLFQKVDGLEKRMEAVERENRELRKVNDMVLELFSGLKPAHELRKALLPENMGKAQDAEQTEESQAAWREDGEREDVEKIFGEEISPARRSALINRYFK